MAQTIDNTLGETVNYSYDYLHRLTAATATNGTWGEAYTYDGFGNLTGKTPTQGYAPAMTGSTGSNATGGALNGQWDVEKRPMTQGATQATPFYIYDPWGRRIWKQWYDTTYGTTNCEAYFYGATGQKLESYSCTYSATSLGATLQGINTYFAGKMLSEKGVFIATDRLGSVRGDSNGVSMSYYPWGEERGQGTADDRTKFAGYYRDMPGQDYANARFYSASTGSFWSPDPGGMKTADAKDPPTWNRISYTAGDPINRIDPSGRCWIWGGEVWIWQACDSDGDGGSSPGPPPEDPGPPDPGPNGGPDPSWDATLTALQAATKRIASATFSDDCVRDIHSLTLEGAPLSTTVVRDQAGIERFIDGQTSPDNLTLLWSDGSTVSGTASSFFSPTGSHYLAGLTAVTNDGGINSYWQRGAEATDPNLFAGDVMHELLHSIGFTDAQIQTALGFAVSNDTTNISKKLGTDCFGYTGK